jgi:hypothetical protein
LIAARRAVRINRWLESSAPETLSWYAVQRSRTGEAASFEQRTETHFLAERIPLGVDWQECQVDVAYLQSALERIQGLSVFAKPGVKEGFGDGR